LKREDAHERAKWRGGIQKVLTVDGCKKHPATSVDGDKTGLKLESSSSSSIGWCYQTPAQRWGEWRYRTETQYSHRFDGHAQRRESFLLLSRFQRSFQEHYPGENDDLKSIQSSQNEKNNKVNIIQVNAESMLITGLN